MRLGRWEAPPAAWGAESGAASGARENPTAADPATAAAAAPDRKWRRVVLTKAFTIPPSAQYDFRRDLARAPMQGRMAAPKGTVQDNKGPRMDKTFRFSVNGREQSV